MNADRFYIDGEWVGPSGAATMPIMDPSMDEQVGTVALGRLQDVDHAVQAARAAFDGFGRWPKADRLALLRRIRQGTKDRLEDLAQAMSLEMGAPIGMAREVQAEAGIGHADGFIEALEAQEERWTLSNGDTLLREPIGPAGMITPWNWPINQIALKVLPALATGCPAILKPSEYTPLSAQIYAQILHDAGVPAGAFALIHGTGAEVGDALARHPELAMISFTGSPATARWAGPRPTRSRAARSSGWNTTTRARMPTGASRSNTHLVPSRPIALAASHSTANAVSPRSTFHAREPSSSL